MSAMNPENCSPVFTLLTPTVVADVTDLRCDVTDLRNVLVYRRLVEGCFSLQVLCIDSNREVVHGLLLAISNVELNKWMGEGYQARYLRLYVLGR